MSDMADDAKRKENIEKLAIKVLGLARDTVVVNMRFLDIAAAALKLIPMDGLNGMATDSLAIYYDPKWVLETYEAEPNMIARTYLHMMLHLVFFHSFQYDKVDKVYWSFACDAAVENTILSLGLNEVRIKKDAEIEARIKILKKQVDSLTAEKLYRHLRINELSEAGKIEWHLLFNRDDHKFWEPKTEVVIMKEQWVKISERVKADLKSFTKARGGNEELLFNLKEATRERHDYGEILKRFTVLGEDMRINDDEFDYIFYNYGLTHFGNMPLVEPLEYKDSDKIRDFVIAIDTSASCRGEIVENFLKKTFDILKDSESFFTKVNIHIIQCDTEIRDDKKITDRDELKEYFKSIKLKGFGGTDFRPVFDHVDELIKKKELQKLKGLIYFSDGFGIFPERMPSYDVMFAFLEGEDIPALPPWAMKVVLSEDSLITF